MLGPSSRLSLASWLQPGMCQACVCRLCLGTSAARQLQGVHYRVQTGIPARAISGVLEMLASVSSRQGVTVCNSVSGRSPVPVFLLLEAAEA
jgi:hypothetical protein